MAEKNKDNDDLLENFRRQWESEISAARNQQSATSSNQTKSKTFLEGKELEKSLDRKDIDDEEKATSMYLCGVRHEESGEVVEAIRYYKRAMQLVPDIEQRIYRYPKNKELSTNIPITNVNSTELIEKGPISNDNNNLFDDSDGELPIDMLEKLQRLALHDGRICTPQEEPKGTHISALPREIIVYLLKWVVSSDLDLRSLEQVSLVCRGLYLCSRDSELWKLACSRVWNSEITPKSCGFNSYRDMFICRPRLQFSGCYISKTSYVRPGENSFQDTNYQPWHMVNYFRYLRFYPDRTAVMSTTADMPNLVVGKRLKKKDPSCFHGFYSLHGNVVTCIFKRKRIPEVRLEHNRPRRRNEDVNNNGSKMIEQVFQLELEIKSVKQKLHCALHWNGYTVQTVYQDTEPSTVHFDINPTRFPPLWFSRVRSYNAQSEQPL